MNEFSVIEKYFKALTMGHAGTAGLLDDAAVLSITEGHELVVTSDTLNEGVHFLDGELPENVARKALRVNLSDLASMGATPLCYQLNIAFPNKPEEEWLADFSAALLLDNKRYDIFCSGGDTTSIKGGKLSVSITAMGVVPKGRAVRRTGAKVGDTIVITGGVGDAALGLKLLMAGDMSEPSYQAAIDRYLLPDPRVGMEALLQEYVNASADISDGLFADCMHIAKASSLGVEIDFGALKFSKAVIEAVENGAISMEEAARGGDDYELILAVSSDKLEVLLGELGKYHLNPMVIGSFTESTLKLYINGTGSYRIDVISQGWQHF